MAKNHAMQIKRSQLCFLFYKETEENKEFSIKALVLFANLEGKCETEIKWQNSCLVKE